MRFGRTGLWCWGAVFALLGFSARASAQTTFTGGGAISVTQSGIGGASETGSPTLNVSGLSGTVATVAVELLGVTFDTNGNNGNNFGLAGRDIRAASAEFRPQTGGFGRHGQWL